MQYVNKVQLTGRLGYDPILKTAPSGKVYCRFNLATLSAWVDDEHRTQKSQDWHRCVVWDDSAQDFIDQCQRNSHIELTGRLQPRFIKEGEGIRREIVEVRVTSWRVISGGKGPDKLLLDNDIPF